MHDALTTRESLHALFRERFHVEVPSDETDLFATKILDSLHVVDLMLHIERECGMTISLETIDLEKLRSIASIADLIASLDPCGEGIGVEANGADLHLRGS